MPLTPGSSRAVVSGNIKEMINAGYPQKQAVAASLSNARRHPRADGGAIDSGSVIDKAVSLAHSAARQRSATAEAAKLPGDDGFDEGAGGFAGGGFAAPEIPYFERQEARDISYAGEHPGGLVASPGPGRTDIHNVDVAAGSYVLPADVVSGLGEGNTLNGASVIDRMLRSEPYGIRPWPLPHRDTIPRPPRPFEEPASPVRFEVPHFAAGGAEGKPIPIVIAGGEYVVRPEAVAKLGGGDIKRGHAILDAFVKHVRKNTVKTLKKLPGPVK